jgi:hypothetical protein
VVTSFGTSSGEHLLLTSDSHLALVAGSDRWIIDSGASEHMTGDKSLLENIESLNPVTRITTAGNGALEATSQGSVSLINSRKEKVTHSRGSTSSQSRA